MSKNKRSVLIETERSYILDRGSDFFEREAYNTLRTNLGFALAGAPEHKIIAVSSAMQGEGKSLTAINIAVSLAETEKKVLLIDVDLRRPKLSRLLSLNSEFGLSDLLVDSSKLQKVMLKFRGAVDVILAGSIPPNPSELLGSNLMSSFLEKMREHFDYIVIDLPPINMVTDAVVVAPKTDGLLFVVKANESERGPVRAALEQLEFANANVLGFVFNAVPLNKTGYGYNKYSHHMYKKYGYRKDYSYSAGYAYGYQENPEDDKR